MKKNFYPNMIITWSLQLEFFMFEIKKVKHLLLPASKWREFTVVEKA